MSRIPCESGLIGRFYERMLGLGYIGGQDLERDTVYVLKSLGFVEMGSKTAGDISIYNGKMTVLGQPPIPFFIHHPYGPNESPDFLVVENPYFYRFLELKSRLNGKQFHMGSHMALRDSDYYLTDKQHGPLLVSGEHLFDSELLELEQEHLCRQRELADKYNSSIKNASKHLLQNGISYRCSARVAHILVLDLRNKEQYKHLEEELLAGLQRQYERSKTLLHITDDLETQIERINKINEEDFFRDVANDSQFGSNLNNTCPNESGNHD